MQQISMEDYKDLGFSKRYLSANQLSKEYGMRREEICELARRKDQDFAIQTKPGGKIRCDVIKFVMYIKKKNLLKNS